MLDNHPKENQCLFQKLSKKLEYQAVSILILNLLKMDNKNKLTK